MRRNLVTGNVARENRDRIHADLGEVGAEPSAQPRREPLDERLLHRLGAKRAAHHVPDRTFLGREAANVFGEQIDLDPGVSPVLEVMSLAASRHGTVVGCHRHRRQHGVVDVVREDAVEHEVVERRLAGTAGVYR